MPRRSHVLGLAALVFGTCALLAFVDPTAHGGGGAQQPPRWWKPPADVHAALRQIDARSLERYVARQSSPQAIRDDTSSSVFEP